MNRALTAALVICAALAAGFPSMAAEAIGHVKTVEGMVSIVRAEPATAAIGDALMVDDVVETGADGAVGITFVDGSIMALGPNSRVVMEEYSFDSTAFTGDFLANLSQGTLVIQSGDIARTSSEAMRVTTPDAVLGVRGTTFAIKVEPRS